MADPQPERNTLAIRGRGAELRWGYAKAATLGAWALNGSPGAWILTATILERDDFKVSQRPLKIVTPNGWTWALTSLQIEGWMLTASVTSQEQPHATVPSRSA